MPRKKIMQTHGVGARHKVRTRRRKHNLIDDIMETAQQPGIVRGALILGGILIVLACVGIVYVFFSSERYTAVSPAMQNKMIVTALKVDTNISPQESVNIVDKLKASPPSGKKEVQSSVDAARLNAEIIKSLSN